MLASALSQAKAPKLWEAMLLSRCWGWRVLEQPLHHSAFPEVRLVCRHRACVCQPCPVRSP